MTGLKSNKRISRFAYEAQKKTNLEYTWKNILYCYSNIVLVKEIKMIFLSRLDFKPFYLF